MFIGLWCLAAILGAVLVVSERMKHVDKDYWLRYKEQLEADRKWWNCTESEDGCDWPGLCSPGDCRRVEDFRRPDLDEEVEE